VWEAIGAILSVLLLVYLISDMLYTSWAADKALALPPKTGKESFIGRNARVIELLSESRGEKLLRAELDGVSWEAVARDTDRSDIKVGDTVKVKDVENLTLVVVL
jgi:membrane protein implicated in regulation of membrane protease activity